VRQDLLRRDLRKMNSEFCEFGKFRHVKRFHGIRAEASIIIES
jgi:hypothetical protein